MMVFLTYDISTQSAAGTKRLGKVAKQCQNYGQRLQNSVFECILDLARLKQLQNDLENLIDHCTDSLRYYYMEIIGGSECNISVPKQPLI